MNYKNIWQTAIVVLLFVVAFAVFFVLGEALLDSFKVSIPAFQIGGGIYVAVFYPWGSSWFASSATPYLRSIFMLNVEIAYVSEMPLAVKLHIVGAFVLIGFLPFTRLAHLLVAPVPYLWRKQQVVRWYRGK